MALIGFIALVVRRGRRWQCPKAVAAAGRDGLLGPLQRRKSSVNLSLPLRSGCIIRSAFLGDIKQAFDKNPKLTKLLPAPFFKKAIKGCQRSWRKVVSTAVKKGIPVPAFSTALAFFDGFRSARLPANLLQAQRDYFGAHTYQRLDDPPGAPPHHTNWTGHGGTTASSTYTV